MTIHWFDSLMKRIIFMGQMATTTAAASSTTFFQNVCQLVSTMASPKQPQSLMGSVNASQSVNGVIIAMMITERRELNLRLMAKSRKMPMQNSVAETPIESASVAKSGSVMPRCMACR